MMKKWYVTLEKMETMLQMQLSIRNILQPTRISFYDIWLKSYGSNSGFHVFGDLDFDLWQKGLGAPAAYNFRDIIINGHVIYMQEIAQ